MLAYFVNGADVGMVQCRGRASLTAETFEGLRVFGKVIRKEFQGNETSEFRVLGLINHTHAAAAQLLDNAVMRDQLAREGIPILCDLFVLSASESLRGHFHRRALRELPASP